MSYATEQSVLNAQWNAAVSAQQTEAMRQAPHVLMRPSLVQDGNAWLAVYGDLPTGVVGSGSTPEEAMKDFDAAWVKPATLRGPSITDPVDECIRGLLEKEKKLTEAILSARNGVLDLLPADAGGDELKAHIVQRIDAAIGCGGPIPNVANAVLNVGLDGCVRYQSGAIAKAEGRS